MLDLTTAIERARVDDPDASAAWDDRMASRMGVFRSLAAVTTKKAHCAPN